jgi:hypothetical protein
MRLIANSSLLMKKHLIVAMTVYANMGSEILIYQLIAYLNLARSILYESLATKMMMKLPNAVCKTPFSSLYAHFISGELHALFT